MEAAARTRNTPRRCFEFEFIIVAEYGEVLCYMGAVSGGRRMV